MQNVVILAIIYIQQSKPENICIFVINNNKGFISKTLKVIGLLGRKFDFFGSSGFEIQRDFERF